jgi:prephenate dehydratase
VQSSHARRARAGYLCFLASGANVPPDDIQVLTEGCFMSLDSANTIAFMGVAGANADMACRRAYPYMMTLPCPSFEDVFEAVEQGKAALGFIPVENSQAGRVAEIHTLLPKTNLHFVSEYFLPVEHVLAAPKGTSIEQVKDVYSHPQALMQCRDHIRSLGITAHPYSNTAVAAEQVAQWNDPSKAAICSRLAAELYGLDVLQDPMQDAADNVTVFVALSREPHAPEVSAGPVVTTLLFTVRNIPSALYKSLGGFATNGVNILKLESYIPGGNSQQAQFFLTLEGHTDERSVQLALEELGFFTKQVKVLGMYTAAPERNLVTR